LAIGKRLGDWLDERTAWRAVLHRGLHEPIPGGASWAYVFGSVLVFLLVLQMTTGVLLAFYYSPSATDAWASVAHIQDQVSLGWLVRGLHHHGASAMVIVVGFHLLQTASYGAYRRPREVNWLIGVLLLGLVMAFALTGYLLPWDQTGYWATKVATGIAGSTPAVGGALKEAVQGGNEYGNLTLTRFFALHVFVLPALTVGLVVVHVALFRKHGVTPRGGRSADELAATSRPFWPDQLFRDFVAMAIVFAAMVAWTVHVGGARLDAPADPSSAFDARPEWYFRWLYQLLKYFSGTIEKVVALGVPVVVGGFLLAVPFTDRAVPGRPRPPWRRGGLLLLVLGLMTMIGLTLASYAQDAGDDALAARRVHAETRARQARALAIANGVPAAGGVAVFQTAPYWRARSIWARSCAHCHDGKKRKAPRIGPGYNSRAWIRGFVTAPSSDPYWGRTKLARTDDAMDPVDQTGADLDAVVEMVYAETGATDVDQPRAARGRQIFEDVCSDCHEREPGKASGAAPNLAGRGSPAYLATLIEDPSGPTFFPAHNAMPKFRDDLSAADRAQLAEYLTWLRTATADDLARLGEP
jgi:ubiquinol-cytochrome c reductase cytochrome b subunit